jgi:hypothetical protein
MEMGPKVVSRHGRDGFAALAIQGRNCCPAPRPSHRSRVQLTRVRFWAEEGRVVEGVVAIGGSVTVLSEGRVTNGTVAIGGDVILKANARVEGGAVAIGGEVIKEAGASVGDTG